MRKLISSLTLFVLLATGPLHADYSVSARGDWPKDWPAELEPLRKQAQTFVGPTILFRHHLIPFTDREQFEAAWPHLLKVKTKGAPIILVSAPKTDFFAIEPAGVCLHSPPANGTFKHGPIKSDNVRERWMWTTYFVLAVDGEIVDLNRIELPEDTPIVDERFIEKSKY